MQAGRFVSWSPLEVGDSVIVKGWHDPFAKVTEIETVHKASTGTVEIRHYVDGCMVPLDEIACRVVDGHLVTLADCRVACETVKN